jgi:hypothetical protein
VHFGLERVLHGEDASEGLSLKILEYTPYAPGPPTVGFNTAGKVTIIVKKILPIRTINEKVNEKLMKVNEK